MSFPFQGAIFDMDDTLIDSMSHWDRITHDLLAEFGVESDESLLKKMGAMTLEASLRFIVAEFSIPKQEFMRLLLQKVDGLYEAAELLPGAYEFLLRLHRLGIPIALATSNARHLAELCLRRNGVFDWFSFLLCADEEGVDKTTPALYLKAAEMFGLAPEQCVVFEDLYAGLKSAKSAGFYTVGVLGSYNGRDVKEREAVIEVSDFAVTDYHSLTNRWLED